MYGALSVLPAQQPRPKQRPDSFHPSCWVMVRNVVIFGDPLEALFQGPNFSTVPCVWLRVRFILPFNSCCYVQQHSIHLAGKGATVGLAKTFVFLLLLNK